MLLMMVVVVVKQPSVQVQFLGSESHHLRSVFAQVAPRTLQLIRYDCVSC